jgi:hypothetical protein
MLNIKLDYELHLQLQVPCRRKRQSTISPPFYICGNSKKIPGHSNNPGFIELIQKIRKKI